MLVSLSFGMPRQSRQLKAEAVKVEEEKNAERGTVRVSAYYWQSLVGGKEVDGLSNLKSFFNAWRKEHDALTRSWDGDNLRLLPAKLVDKYMAMTEKFQLTAPERVDDFLEETYPELLNTAPTRMGELYDPADFPALSECRERIKWDVSILPLPEATQIRKVALINESWYDLFQQSTDEKVAKAIEQVRQDTWDDVLKPVQHIIEVLSKDKGKIFETLITDVREIINLVPAFNLTNDQELTNLAEECRVQLSGVTPDELRKDPEIRKQTLLAAQAIVGKFGSLGGRKFAV